MMRSLLRRALLALLLLTSLSACSTLRQSKYGIDRESAPRHIATAKADVEGKHWRRAIDRLVEVRATRRLVPEDRAQTERLLTVAVDALMERYEGEGYGSDNYNRLFELDLPPRMRATAGIRTAEKLLDEGHPVLAYKKIREVDRVLPTHSVRVLAGEVLAKIGLSLIRTRGNYYFFFSYAARGMTALEYLVVQYPLSTGCPEAYAELAAYYERKGDIDYAIERHEDLVVYHSDNPLAVVSAAKLPGLRMRRLRRDDYDRAEMLLAAREIERWLLDHPGHELEQGVRELQVDCMTRIAKNDLILARYYKRIGAPFGARMHAERALARADRSGLEATATEARSLLAKLPASDAERPTVEILPAPGEEPSEDVRP